MISDEGEKISLCYSSDKSCGYIGIDEVMLVYHIQTIHPGICVFIILPFVQNAPAQKSVIQGKYFLILLNFCEKVLH